MNGNMWNTKGESYGEENLPNSPKFRNKGSGGKLIFSRWRTPRRFSNYYFTQKNSPVVSTSRGILFYTSSNCSATARINRERYLLYVTSEASKGNALPSVRFS